MENVHSMEPYQKSSANEAAQQKAKFGLPSVWSAVLWAPLLMKEDEMNVLQ